MSGYIPPFTVTAKAVNLIAEISAQIERYAIRLEQNDSLRLRKANRIKTIHSSLAIEGSGLSEGQVRDILDGKQVVAPVREIQEVKNAIKTYELYPKLDAFSVKDLLRAHGVMMQALCDDAGQFRRGGVGVFEGQRCVHLAPPPERVPLLIDELFNWLRHSKDHLLIRSCVFHYEFEFIHPFSDGNGRTGRLWQSLILGRLNPIFEHLPVENMVYANQMKYYDAITASTDAANSGPFIDFMLQEILDTLKSHQGKELDVVGNNVGNDVGRNVGNDIGRNVGNDVGKRLTPRQARIVALLRDEPYLTAADLAKIIKVTARTIERDMTLLKEQKIITRVGGTKGGHWKVS